jgi:uncharacterized protein (TIGR03067 family)
MKIALLLTVALGLTKDDAVKKEMDKFQGEWIVVNAEHKGKNLSEDDRKKLGDAYLLTRIRIKDDKLRCWIKEKDNEPKEGEDTAFKLDITKSPARISFGQNYELSAVYKLEGDKLKVCVDIEVLQSREPPASLDTSKNERAYAFVFKRAKK